MQHNRCVQEQKKISFNWHFNLKVKVTILTFYLQLCFWVIWPLKCIHNTFYWSTAWCVVHLESEWGAALVWLQLCPDLLWMCFQTSMLSPVSKQQSHHLVILYTVCTQTISTCMLFLLVWYCDLLFRLLEEGLNCEVTTFSSQFTDVYFS